MTTTVRIINEGPDAVVVRSFDPDDASVEPTEICTLQPGEISKQALFISVYNSKSIRIDEDVARTIKP